MIVFVFGWGLAVVFSIYELIYGRIVEGMDIVVGILGTLHSLVVPCVYGYTNRRVRIALAARLSWIINRRRSNQVCKPYLEVYCI